MIWVGWGESIRLEMSAVDDVIQNFIFQLWSLVCVLPLCLDMQ